jgi:glucose/arabinose dehydrogenase
VSIREIRVKALRAFVVQNHVFASLIRIYPLFLAMLKMKVCSKRSASGFVTGFLLLAAFWGWIFAAILPTMAEPIDWPQLRITQIATGAQYPAQITHAGDGSGRIFVVQEPGQVRIIRNGSFLSTNFLDISGRVNLCGRGLCSIAFPPGYSTNQHFYVQYNRSSDGAAVISRFSASANPDLADPATEHVLLTVPQSYFPVGGGRLAFGPDGYLYLSLGDADYTGDPANVSQSPLSLLGKMLRIDVESSTNSYTIPLGNPFVSNPAYLPEIWALGLQRPWHFSFDRLTGDLFLGDIGASAWQEVDFQSSSAGGGQNYGWRIMEGNHTNNVPPGFDLNSLTAPLLEYGNNVGSCVIGGFVYRGPGSTRMQGIYFYGDRSSGRIWSMKADGTNWQSIELVKLPYNIATFGEDEAGRLYVAQYIYSSASIFLLDDNGAAAPPTFSPAPGTYISEQLVTITSISTNVLIHYTTDGRDPTESDPAVVSGGTVPVNTSLTLKATAFRPDLLPSAVSAGTYTLVVATPAFDPADGPITNGTQVHISSATSGVTVHYTTDGTDPDVTSPIYSDPLSLNGNTVLKARGYKPAFNDSDIQTTLFDLIDYDQALVTTVAGNGQTGAGDGMGSLARFSSPRGICIDPAGNLYVADTGNHLIRKISPAGLVTTVAGTGQAGFHNGPGSTAQFSSPVGICLDPAGNIYVADNGNYRIRKIDPAGNVSTFSGSGSRNYQDGPPTSASFMNPQFLESDSQTNFYVGDWARIRKLSPNGTASNLAGNGVNTLTGLGGDIGLCVNKSGTVFAASYFGRVFQIAPDGTLSLFAGGSSAIADGPRESAGFTTPNGWQPRDTTADRFGNIYVSDYNRIRRIAPSGWVSTLAGSIQPGYADGDAPSARFNQADGLCVDAQGTVYVADTGNHSIRKIAPQDSDGDGIPDVFEGGTTPFIVGIDDRFVDSDHDGASNAAEFHAGTDPLDSNSFLALENLTVVTNGHIQISWRSVSGVNYTIKYSDDLHVWNVLRPPVQGNDSVITVIDPAFVSQGQQRFYRVFVTEF